jgi:glutathione S-transferase
MLEEPLLYDLNDSPFCLKARICLQLKGLPFRRVPLTLGRMRELRRLNPLGKVPVLVHGEAVVPDSSRIARHLERLYPEPPLLPADPQARAYAAVLEEWADEALYVVIGAFKWLNPENRRRALANTIPEMTGAVLAPVVGPLIARRIRRRYAVWGWKPATLTELRARMREQLSALATLLDGRTYLVGRSPTLADLSVFAQLSWLARYAEGRLLAEVPVVERWLARVGEPAPVSAALSA